VTVGVFLARWRTTTLAASSRAATTRELYASLSKKHLELAPIAAVPLGKLRAHHVEALILELREAGLADSTVRSVYGVLRLALDAAVRDGLLAKNPVALVARPGVKRQEARYLNEAETAALLSAAKGSRYWLAVAVMAATGARRGEVCALSWSGLDLDGGTMRIAATVSRVAGELVIAEPKTERSRRTVPLAPPLVTALKAHRADQDAERAKAGDQWQGGDRVFLTELGGPVDPRNLLRVVQAAAKAAKLEGRVGAHSLRHAAAVGWLEDGVHIRAVADLLGHSSIAVTGDVYGHSSDATARGAVEGLTNRLGL
jgi:integrase